MLSDAPIDLHTRCFFFRSLPLGVDLPCFFPLFFDGGFEAIALAHRLFVSSRLSFALFFFLSQIVGVVTPEFGNTAVFELPDLVHYLIEKITVMAHNEQSPIKCLELSDEKADAVLVEVARRLVGEDRACMLGECRGNLGACFLPAAHRLLRHSGDVETGEHLTTVLSRIKVEFIELADEGNAAEAPDVGVRNGKIAAQNFKQAGFACAIVSHQADAIVGVDFQLFDIQDIAAGIFQKDVFSFDYEFHRLNRLLCISLLLEAQPCQKRLLTSIFRLCPIAGASVLTLRKPANPKMIVGDE